MALGRDGDDEAPVNALVLGAGISGLVSAGVLLRQGARSVTVVDAYPRVGGNHLDQHVSTPDGDQYTFDIGSLVFQDDSPLLEHFPELLPRYVPITPNWSRLNPQGRVTAYPFSVTDDVLAAGPVEAGRLLASAVLARWRRRPQRSARDFADHWLGPRLVDRSGLGRYLARFCGVPADQVDLAFAYSRMMWIAENARLSTVARRALQPLRRLAPTALVGPAGPVHRPNTQLARPFAGFSDLYAPAVASLEARGARFLLGEPPRHLRRTGVPGGETLHALTVGVRTLHAHRVVSTVPVDVALALAGLPRGEPLPTVRLTSLFYSFAGRRGFGSSVLYNFSHEGAWKRLTVYSDFYGVAASGREYLGVEVVGDRGQDVDEAAAAFRSHTAANGLLDGDLRLEGSHHLDHAYPIYTGGSGSRAARGVAALAQVGIESLGRQGAFQYQPTARHSTLDAEAALQR